MAAAGHILKEGIMCSRRGVIGGVVTKSKVI